MGEKLGEGQHAIVYKCFLKEDPNEVYAVKVVSDDDQEKLQAHEQEFTILSSLKHKNIVSSREMFRDDCKN